MMRREEFIKEQIQILKKFLDTKLGGLIEATKEQFKKGDFKDAEIGEYITTIKELGEKTKNEVLKGFKDLFGNNLKE